MRSVIVFSLTLILLTCCTTGVMAAQRGLFLLGQYRQWVDLSYQYDGTQAETNSSGQHRFTEDYHFDIAYAVYNPRILNGRFTADVRTDQTKFTGTGTSPGISSGVGFLYNLAGVAFDRSSHPIDFFTTSSISEEPQEFTRGYQVKTDAYGAGLSLLNTHLPLRVSFDRLTNETDGLPVDFRQTHNRVLINLSHKYGSRSLTQLDISAVKDTYQALTGANSGFTNNYSFSLGNNLSLLPSSRNLTLDSHLKVVEQSGDNPSNEWNVQESLLWQPGKALTSGLDYTHDNLEYSGLNQQSDNGRAWVQHRLFESLTTGMEVRARRDTLSSGYEQEVAGRFSLNYKKVLPSSSLLTLEGYEQYGVTDRRFGDGRLTAVNESHQANAFFQPFTLKNPNVDLTSIVIRNKDPLANQNQPYVEGTDYQVQTVGNLTQIATFPGSRIKEGATLLVTYAYTVDPAVQFATNAHSASGNLWLFSNKYRFYGRWEEVTFDLLSGRADQVNLPAQRAYHFGFETKVDELFMGLEYTNIDSDNDKEQSIQGTLRYTGQLGTDNYSVFVTDRYTLIEPTAFTGPGTSERDENNLNAGGIYNTRLFNSILCSVAANYFNVRGLYDRDDFSGSLRLSWGMGKLRIMLLAQAYFRDNAGSWTSDEHVRFNLTRYF